MTRNKKEEIVKYFSDEFSNAEGILIADFKGITVKELESLRANAREKEVSVKVAKNTLVKVALKNNNLELDELKETNIFLWSKDQLSVSKVAVNFEKSNENFTIKQAILEKKVVDLSEVQVLATLPGKEELLGMLLSVWTAPIRNLTVGLDNLRIKKEEES